jgi:hypothetical protein
MITAGTWLAPGHVASKLSALIFFCPAEYTRLIDYFTSAYAALFSEAISDVLYCTQSIELPITE